MDARRTVSAILVVIVAPGVASTGLVVRAGEIEAPVSVRIDVPEGVAPGVEFLLKGTIELHADAPRLVVRFETEGPFSSDAAPIVLGPLFAGESVPFEAPVACKRNGNAVMHVWAEVADALGAPLFANRGSLYARLRSVGNLFGHGGFMVLEKRAIEVRRDSGRMSAEQADRALRELVRMSPRMSSTPPNVPALTPRDRKLNRLVGLPSAGATVIGVDDRASAADDKVIVQGTVRWQDENGDWHPVWGGSIEVQVNPGPGYRVFTDAAGNYSVEVHPGHIAVLYDLRSLWATVTGLTGSYYAASDPYFDVPGGTVLDVSFDFERGVPANDANSVFQATNLIGAYAEGLTGRRLRASVQWPNGEESSYYRNGRIYMEEPDRYDWDVVHHEYGHFVMHEFRLADNPGGRHRAGDCFAFTRGSKDQGVRLAWAEGWPSYFAITGQLEMQMGDLGIPRVGDVWYQDLEDTAVAFSLESEDPPDRIGLGEDNELSVQRLLFDLYDSEDDGRDTISRSDESIWSGMAGERLDRPRFSQFWNRLRSGQPGRVQLQMGAIAAEHGIGPAPEMPIEGALVTPAERTFSWRANVGCPDSYDGDRFDLVFYDAETRERILTVPDLPTTSYTLDPAELQVLTAVTHRVRWAVEAWHDAFPSSGPYLGDSLAATVNHPPLAVAGDDVIVPCTSATATPVTLDGTASTDADGDALTHAWSADGVSFDDPSSPTPSGGFPVGSTAVDLTVSDTFQEDVTSTTVTVTDVEAPELSVKVTPEVLWPANHRMWTVTAEVTAADGCDPDPEITLVSITSDESSGRGLDILDAEIGHDDRQFRLRASRGGKGNGRVYTLVYRATDREGNSAEVTAEVRVPHDRRR